jgi:hypothetical protein
MSDFPVATPPTSPVISSDPLILQTPFSSIPLISTSPNTLTSSTSPTTTENENENNDENTRGSVFKILNQTITRRFTMPIEKPTWSEVELKVRELFSIPSSVSLGLTYLDEEGEPITLSSQSELEDYYKQVKIHDLSDLSFDVNYKFSLVIFTPIRDDENDDNDDSLDYPNSNNNLCPTQ